MRNDPRRSLALDALRGLAIVLMIFSGRIPYGILPDWMYHAQVPPPDHHFNPALPGITWVDLVFPFFLFSMGAAIPLALQRRLDAGVPQIRLAGSILWRSALLAFFAIYVAQIRPWNMPADAEGRMLPLSWVLSLAGFLLLFPILMRLPEHLGRAARIAIRLGGWGGVALLLFLVRFRDGSGFAYNSNDIIILVLANVYLTGAFIWIATRKNLLLRIGVMALLTGIILSAETTGWIRPLWHGFPLPWLLNLAFQKYLLLILPGTIAGEMLLRWGAGGDPDAGKRWNSLRHALIALLMLGLNVVAVIGFKGRWVVETTLALSTVSVLSLVLLRNPGSGTEHLLRSLFGWGAFLLILGCTFEPFEGGIKKDHPTISYYFVTGGLAIAMLILFLVIIDVGKMGKRLFLLTGSGQNPLVAYAGIHSLLPPILGLLSLDLILEQATPGPWLGVLRGALVTIAVAAVAAFLARKKIILRA